MMLTKKLAVLGLSALMTGLVTYAAPVRSRAADNVEIVKITASKFHFTPDRITLAKGQPVTLQLTSADRTHGFMVKPLGIDTDIEPGKTTAITIKPEKAGTYTTICDHYCGLGHNSMKMKIVVQ
jgi:cytochrome c oxidase subunit II